MKKLLLLLALGVCSFKAFSQNITEWNCDNTVAPTLIDPIFVSFASDISVVGAGTLGYPLGCPGSATDRSASWNNWPLQPINYDPGYYIEFSIVAGQNFSISQISLSTKRTNTGPITWQMRWSVSGYSIPLYTNLVTAADVSCINHTIGLGPTPVSAGQTVTFRIFPGSSNGSTGRWNVDNIKIEAFSSPLPISLLSFTGETMSGKSFLKWQTATEEDNSHFTIERSQDARDWESLGIVPGAGDSYVTREYSFVDDSPPTGTVYYRLLQTDWDGAVTTYHTIALSHESRALTIYPNPAPKGETLRIEGGAYSLVEILDGSGKLVVKKYAYEALVLDLASGMYLARVTDMEGRTNIQRLILTE